MERILYLLLIFIGLTGSLAISLCPPIQPPPELEIQCSDNTTNTVDCLSPVSKGVLVKYKCKNSSDTEWANSTLKCVCRGKWKGIEDFKAFSTLSCGSSPATLEANLNATGVNNDTSTTDPSNDSDPVTSVDASNGNDGNNTAGPVDNTTLTNSNSNNSSETANSTAFNGTSEKSRSLDLPGVPESVIKLLGDQEDGNNTANNVTSTPANNASLENSSTPLSNESLPTDASSTSEILTNVTNDLTGSSTTVSSIFSTASSSDNSSISASSSDGSSTTPASGSSTSDGSSTTASSSDGSSTSPASGSSSSDGSSSTALSSDGSPTTPTSGPLTTASSSADSSSTASSSDGSSSTASSSDGSSSTASSSDGSSSTASSSDGSSSTASSSADSSSTASSSDGSSSTASSSDGSTSTASSSDGSSTASSTSDEHSSVATSPDMSSSTTVASDNSTSPVSGESSISAQNNNSTLKHAERESKDLKLSEENSTLSELPHSVSTTTPVSLNESDGENNSTASVPTSGATVSVINSNDTSNITLDRSNNASLATSEGGSSSSIGTPEHLVVNSTTPTSTSNANGSSTEGTIEYQTLGLNLHNKLRKNHGVPPLIMNETLNQEAQSWAENLLNQSKLVASPGKRSYSENLFKISGGAQFTNDYAIETAIKSWYSSSKWFNFTNPKPTGFSQIVWKATTQLGIGLASANDTSIIVATYFPRGNVVAVGTNDSGYLFKKNVFPLIENPESVFTTDKDTNSTSHENSN